MAAVTDSVEELLSYDSVNENSPATILLIHGNGCGRADWNLVEPHLKDFNLLIPDLPGFAKSRHLAPFSLERCAGFLNKLISEKAIGGKAHVVGHSLGASVALKLGSMYPEVVDTMLISGFLKLPKTVLTPVLPYAIWANSRFEDAMPRSLVSWLLDGTDIPRGDPKDRSLQRIRETFVDSLSPDGWPQPWRARTLVIAATKRGILPSNDNVEQAVKVAEIGREQNSETYAVSHPDMRHAWPRQDPVLFAATVRSFIMASDLPKGFHRL
ncbi:hypothetical protein M409DRAFT_66450 [Zasmidium cellare ATCC 36951]|uniref:AB hydrolase-1 domain-containing protein n=1 Tax=Zasmidium cellare ATCC 36951 TaxID=1080233 RepID=A0A6A6CL91_ZASCE|nr:uncharacterized protein M409DRAFT_66450 [Zasmidium cellare ATCC 36951]KAF2166930.1 hypothetical protein M409DRAFT_66450 [Zasmidium cellare ATCC 36951]